MRIGSLNCMSFANNMLELGEKKRMFIETVSFQSFLIYLLVQSLVDLSCYSVCTLVSGCGTNWELLL